MKFLVLLVVFAFEQIRPLRHDNVVQTGYGRLADYLRHWFDAGQARHGVWAWMAAVVPLTLLTFALEWWLARFNGTVALLFSAAVLFVTVGLQSFMVFLNKINRLMNDDAVVLARDQLCQWSHTDCGELDAQGVSRVAIELGLLSSHRHVFGPVAWFLVFGAAGALLYRLAAQLQALWCVRAVPDSALSDEFAVFAQRAFAMIDWVPARLTAASFAVVGNFQDAVDSWRAQASTGPDAGGAQGISWPVARVRWVSNWAKAKMQLTLARTSLFARRSALATQPMPATCRARSA